MKLKAFDVMIVEHPKASKKEGEESNGDSRLVVEPETVLATDEQNAVVRVIMAKAAQLAGADPNRLEILVRPF